MILIFNISFISIGKNSSQRFFGMLCMLWAVIRQMIGWAKEYLEPGIAGHLTLFLAMAVQVIVPPLPAELIVIAGSKAYGPLLSTLLSGSGLFVGSVIVYYLGIFLRGKFDRLFGTKQLKRVIVRLHEHENLILWVRVLPYNPADVIGYAAGIIGVAPKKFYWTSAATSFIRVALLSWMGWFLKDLSTLLSIIGLLTISAIAAYAMLAKRKGKGWRASLRERRKS